MRIPVRTSVAAPRLRVTPMIDVVFLLITFFMVVSEISRQDQLEIQPPKTEKNADLDEPCLIVTVLHDGACWIGGQRVTLERLREILIVEKRLSEHVKVLVRADKRAHFKHIRAILRLCTEGEIAISRIAFYTQPVEA